MWRFYVYCFPVSTPGALPGRRGRARWLHYCSVLLKKERQLHTGLDSSRVVLLLTAFGLTRYIHIYIYIYIYFFFYFFFFASP